jgi:hypothetical protein
MIKGNGGGGEFKYDTFDILKELFYVPQCTPAHTHTQKIYKKKVSGQNHCEFPGREKCHKLPARGD